ncbi:unnamed protein product [Prorocentrum cordatum]|uniref:Uncharacterized protein n=1 Tax=Prorocentrum cordatum TaxID=2364126 RepID=A0ABN9Q205_9DINO|nr:unnamed protein product [Polarella glacialis]
MGMALCGPSCAGTLRGARAHWHFAAAGAAFGAVAGCGEVGQRLRALLPALQAKLARRAPSWLDILRGCVAMHADADGIDVATAGATVRRRAQGGAPSGSSPMVMTISYHLMPSALFAMLQIPSKLFSRCPQRPAGFSACRPKSASSSSARP